MPVARPPIPFMTVLLLSLQNFISGLPKVDDAMLFMNQFVVNDAK